ncbi:MAG: HAMP domain-containing sensor histidine kinase, partial [Eubacteriales bacterium]|nr:HAMP domain-containing sensor histidine kinase [Eubacteriales bacterium]
WADRIDQNCKYMLEILSSVKKQEINLDFEAEGTFSVREAIEKSLEIIGQEIINRNCEIKTSIKVPDEIKIKGDVNGLVQILNNLIENASEAYEKNGGIVEIRARVEKSNVKISVIDYGIGISEELGNKLFKQMITTKGKKGTGLGLYLSYSTLKVMFHGDMWFETVQNKGTSFNISIPFSK